MIDKGCQTEKMFCDAAVQFPEIDGADECSCLSDTDMNSSFLSSTEESSDFELPEKVNDTVSQSV
eukprot:m.81820 g.81820  ORF g.81820 m.81820 type:complete len:65 (+) comp36261_c0_seq1:493-687(+)